MKREGVLQDRQRGPEIAWSPDGFKGIFVTKRPFSLSLYDFQFFILKKAISEISSKMFKH